MPYTYWIEVANEEVCPYIQALLILGSLYINFNKNNIDSSETHDNKWGLEHPSPQLSLTPVLVQ